MASHINGYFILKSRHMLSKLKSCSGGRKKTSLPPLPLTLFYPLLRVGQRSLLEPPAAEGQEREGELNFPS